MHNFRLKWSLFLTIIYLPRNTEKLCLRPVFNLTTLLERYTYFRIKHALGLILRFHLLSIELKKNEVHILHFICKELFFKQCRPISEQPQEHISLCFDVLCKMYLYHVSMNCASKQLNKNKGKNTKSNQYFFLPQHQFAAQGLLAEGGYRFNRSMQNRIDRLKDRNLIAG